MKIRLHSALQNMKKSKKSHVCNMWNITCSEEGGPLNLKAHDGYTGMVRWKD